MSTKTIESDKKSFSPISKKSNILNNFRNQIIVNTTIVFHLDGKGPTLSGTEFARGRVC